MKFFRIFVLASSLWLLACSTTLEVREITQPHAKAADCGGEDACGIPFRVKEARTVRVFKKFGAAPDGTPIYKEVFASWQVLPGQNRLYSLNFESQYFSNHDVKFNFRGDSTLRDLDMSETIVVDTAIRGIGENVAAVAETALGYDELEQKKEIEALQRSAERRTALQTLADAPGEATEARLQSREAALIAALESLNAVNAAQVTVDHLPSDATPAVIQSAMDSLGLARLRANIAYRRAGIPEPFPGDFP